jgi:DNA-binding NarL/FixJ family response regulator
MVSRTNLAARMEPRTADHPTMIFVNENAFVLGCIVSYMEGEFPGHTIVGLSNVEQIQSFAGEDVALTIVDLPVEKLMAADYKPKIDRLAASFPGTTFAISTNAERHSEELIAEVPGLRGIFPTSFAPPVVAAIIRVIIAGGDYFPRVSGTLPGAKPSSDSPLPAAHPVVPATEAPSFTRRESQILGKLAMGLPNKLIAAALEMPENTVKVHIRNIMRKLKATNRTAAVVAAQRLNVPEAAAGGSMAS